ncbi:MAG: metalloprotease PmbA [Betaproteobacteria bacterium]|nr:metalloprotease PmbA [Betaproteobacteria bacterium]
MSTSNPNPFLHDQAQLRTVVHELLSRARASGASDAVAEVSESSGLSVSVRLGELETIERTRDRSASIAVYKGSRRGFATTSDLSDSALQEAVSRALDLANHTAEDPFSALPDEDDLAHQTPDPALFYPWALTAERATEIALSAESAAREASPLIQNTEGASVYSHHSHFFLANTRDFEGGYAHSRHGFWVAPIARQADYMQRDDWSSSGRDPSGLADPEAVGRYAAQRALSRLGARAIPTGTYPVLFDAPIAAGLVSSLARALSGGALYRKASFLVDSLGTQVFPDHINLEDNPFVEKGIGSVPFDEEGVRVQRRQIIRDGIVEGYFLSTYSARKLGMRTTGNSGGSHNLVLTSRLTNPSDQLPQMLRKLHTGLFVTEVMGQGVNGLTGDYSRGVFGYWVNCGEIVHPVEEVTIAGNLRDMFRGVVALGADAYVQGSRATGSLLIDRMTIAGC